MAFTASIGPVPQEWLPKRSTTENLALPDDGSIPKLLCLVVTLTSGGLTRQQVLLAGLNREKMEAVLARWLKNPANRAAYIDHRLQSVPLLAD